jgi:transposase
VKENDARKLDHKGLEAMRIHAVKRMQECEGLETIAKFLGLDHSTIYVWLARFPRGGWDGLKAKALAGRPPKLSGKMVW